MKKLIFLSALIVFWAMGNSVFAQTFTTARQVGSGWADTTEFQWDQKPWLHVSVSETDFIGNWLLSYWNHQATPSSTYLDNFLYPFSDFVKVGTSDLYLSFDLDQWEAIRKLGDWDISSAVILSSRGPNYSTKLQAYSGDTFFKVVPEPISAGLFLLGGGALALVKRARRKA